MIRHCTACGQVNASFTAQSQVSILPNTIVQLCIVHMARNSAQFTSSTRVVLPVDVCGSLNRTTRGNTYVMVVCVEHFSKYGVLITAEMEKTSAPQACGADGFSISIAHPGSMRCGVCAEMCTDQAGECIEKRRSCSRC
ncbi:hypothetical protein Vretifemale_2226 [Volvox reticuliferus]|nr:hypothetical protein Vretifemale_2226 [Volvox reticuliferus]